ncbi:protein of unknown function [Amycolatopsis marina]|uniref:DUF397 domain-containing protein n=1 Tax=Amycolatopsis marina TaxID=490629 RepID=A0A1I1BMH3_9PSEU|nr:DUF397 domain-containing protein [Amycolatopsis marina]SFB51565.1 protein of unknown function [Amycolatopsis marina]
MNLDQPNWHKSSYSGGENTNCVEVAIAQEVASVRDSKDPGPALVLPPATWHAFLTDLRE